jgi:hypothetical protein
MDCDQTVRGLPVKSAVYLIAKSLWYMIKFVLARLHLQSLAPTNLHWARVVGYGLFFLCVIHKEGLCPSSGTYIPFTLYPRHYSSSF